MKYVTTGSDLSLIRQAFLDSLSLQFYEASFRNPYIQPLVLS